MARVLVIHWNEDEASKRGQTLKTAGHRVEVLWNSRSGANDYRGLRSHRPDAVVIDLSRLPSHGRAVAVYLRQSKITRGVPIIFIEGDREKTARVKQLLPDATYLPDWGRIRGTVTRAIKAGPKEFVAPRTMDGYSKTPLAKKLGIKPGSTLMLLDAPLGFKRMLGPGAKDVSIRRTARGRADTIMIFAKSVGDYARRLPVAIRSMNEGKGTSIWVCWPKKTSGVLTDLSEQVVRKTGLAAGLVDYKIAAIDKTWSGLCFARRRT